MGEMLDECKRVSGSDAAFTWVPAEFLAEHEVQPWLHMPAWAPTGGQMGALLQTDVSRAVAAGLTFRPLADTIRDTLAWAETFPADHEWRAGLPREKEREVLAAWHEASVAAG
jgi:2'-hydroxyisoflavone reductase